MQKSRRRKLFTESGPSWLALIGWLKLLVSEERFSFRLSSRSTALNEDHQEFKVGSFEAEAHSFDDHALNSCHKLSTLNNARILGLWVRVPKSSGKCSRNKKKIFFTFYTNFTSFFGSWKLKRWCLETMISTEVGVRFHIHVTNISVMPGL